MQEHLYLAPREYTGGNVDLRVYMTTLRRRH